MTEKKFLEHLAGLASSVQDSPLDHEEFFRELGKLFEELALFPEVFCASLALKIDGRLVVRSFVEKIEKELSQEPVEFYLPVDSVESMTKASFCRSVPENPDCTFGGLYEFHRVPIEAGGEIEGLLVVQQNTSGSVESSIPDYLSCIAGVIALHLSRQKENALRNDAMILETILELSPDLFWIQDENHRFVTVNRAFLRAVRRAQKQVISKKPEDILLPKQAQALRELHNRVSQTGLSSSVEPQHLSEDKDEAYSISMTPITGTDSRRRYVGSARNVTRYVRMKNEKTRLLELLGRAVYRAAFVTRTDHRLRLHLTRECATMIGSFLYQNYRSFGSSFLSYLRFSVYFYDIGMLTLDRSLITKEGPLDENEWNQLVEHPAKGAELVDMLIQEQGGSHDALEFARCTALFHHERYDGKGYPEGLQSDKIPLSARILAVCDAYGAMRTPRPYNRIFTHMEVVRSINEGSGKRYDPLVVEAFSEIEMHLETLSDRFIISGDFMKSIF